MPATPEEAKVVKEIMDDLCARDPELAKARERVRRLGLPRTTFSEEFLTSFRKKMAATSKERVPHDNHDQG